jgi:hypothetical protein
MASRTTPRRIATPMLSGEPGLQRHLRSPRVLAPKEVKPFPARGADAAPPPDQGMLRKQRRFDRKAVIARDVPDGVDAFEDNVQRGRVAVGNIRHAESSARLSPSSNAKFESVMPIRFQELIDIAVVPGWDGPGPTRKAVRSVCGQPQCHLRLALGGLDETLFRPSGLA